MDLTINNKGCKHKQTKINHEIEHNNKRYYVRFCLDCGSCYRAEEIEK